MHKTSEFAQFVSECLAPLGRVDARAMFGGYGIYVDGLFCAIVHGDTLYLRGDDTSRAEYEAIGAQPFRPFADKPMTMRYFEIGADILENSEALRSWARKAMDAALRASPSSRPRTRRSPRRVPAPDATRRRHPTGKSE